MKNKYEELAGFMPDDASDISIRLKVLAGEIYSVESAVEWLHRETFLQTASGKQLELRAAEHGVTRKPATAATGVLTFGRSTPLWFPATIPAGTVCATSGQDAARYVTTADVTLGTGELSVNAPAKAEKPGAAGNALSGTVTVMVTPPPSVEEVANSADFSGGEDAEGDESLRARLLDRCARPGNGTNAAWYRQLALSCDGIHSANVVPRVNGTGTVAVYLGGTGAAASDDAVSRVKELLSAKKEINVDLTVEAAKTVPVDVSCTVTAKPGCPFSAVESAAGDAVAGYFKSLGVGDPVILAAVTAAVFSVGCVRDCAFTSQGKTMAANELAVLGKLSIAAGGSQ